MEQDYIQHFGILGMHWGVRRTPEQLGHSPRQQRKNRRLANDRGVLSKLGWSRTNESKFEKRFDPEQTKSIHLHREAQRKSYKASELEDKAFEYDKNMNPVVKKDYIDAYKKAAKESADAWAKYYETVSQEAATIFGDGYNKPMKDVYRHRNTYEQYYKDLIEWHSPDPWGNTKTFDMLDEDGETTIGFYPVQNASDSYLKKHFPENYDKFKENFRIGAEFRKAHEIK